MSASFLPASCILTPGPGVVDEAKYAESLGYARVWVNDSPAVYPDAWVILDRIAAATRRIGVGAAVTVPGIRHVVVVAAAARTVATAAPGRLALTVGRGLSGRVALGLKPNSWTSTARFVVQLRELLRGGETVDDAGLALGMGGFHVATTPATRSLAVYVAADGPRGAEYARRLGDGLFCTAVPRPGFTSCIVALHGTVLNDGESIDDERVRAVAGQAVAMRVRYLWALKSAEAVRAIVGGEEWLAAVERIPAARRHVVLFDAHFNDQSNIDAPIVNPANIARFTFTGTREEMAAHLAQLRQGGATEVAFRPAGPDVRRELGAFAAAAGLVPAAP